MVWALERFRSLFLRHDALFGVIATDKNLALMNAVKTIFPECTHLLCRFHINKNVKDVNPWLVTKCLRLCYGCLGEFGLLSFQGSVR